jgi:hypothetical protein
MGVGVALVAPQLPIGDARPVWTRAAPWWDLEADAHLILGTHRHGYGKYDMMVADPELCFGRRLDEFSVLHAALLKVIARGDAIAEAKVRAVGRQAWRQGSKVCQCDRLVLTGAEERFDVVKLLSHFLVANSKLLPQLSSVAASCLFF